MFPCYESISPAFSHYYIFLFRQIRAPIAGPGSGNITECLDGTDSVSDSNESARPGFLGEPCDATSARHPTVASVFHFGKVATVTSMRRSSLMGNRRTRQYDDRADYDGLVGLRCWLARDLLPLQASRQQQKPE
jgi:hypothetical protein